MDGVEALQGRDGLQEGFVEELRVMMEEGERLLRSCSHNLSWARQHMNNHNLDQDALPQPSSESDYPLSLPNALPQLGGES